MYESNKFCDILNISRGITAVTGSGGKTSLIGKLAGELGSKGRVIVCTTTHIFRPGDMAVVSSFEEASEFFAGKSTGVLCVGRTAENKEKLTAPEEGVGCFSGTADYILVESDGSRRLPLKCHAPHEPVIPDGTGRVISLVGLSGMGKKVCDAVHRPELFEDLTGLSGDDIVSAEALAVLIRTEAVRGATLFINQADTPEDMKKAEELAGLIGGRTCESRGTSGSPFAEIFAGSLQNGSLKRIG